MTGTHPLRICVVGAGAIGGLIAPELAAAGHPVSVLARGEHLRAIEAGGLTVIDGEARATVPVRAAREAAALGEQDVVAMPSSKAVLGLLRQRAMNGAFYAHQADGRGFRRTAVP